MYLLPAESLLWFLPLYKLLFLLLNISLFTSSIWRSRRSVVMMLLMLLDSVVVEKVLYTSFVLL